jgi:hypothetical protein
MPEQGGSIIEFPRRNHIGRRVGNLPKNEAQHFYRCSACGGWVDWCDLGQVFDHEGPLPHPADDWRERDLVARRFKLSCRHVANILQFYVGK